MCYNFIAMAAICKSCTEKSKYIFGTSTCLELLPIFEKTNLLHMIMRFCRFTKSLRCHITSQLSGAVRTRLIGKFRQCRKANKQTTGLLLKARERAKQNREENSINLRKTNIAHVPRSRA